MLIEANFSVDDITGDVGQVTATAEGVGTKPDEGIEDAEVELGGDHSCGLVYDPMEVTAGIELLSKSTWWSPRLH